MPRTPTLRTARLFVLCLAFGAFGAGCMPYPIGSVHRRGEPSRPVHRADVRLYRQLPGDVRRYVSDLDRPLRLSESQERTIERLLVDRASDLLDRASPRTQRHVYPFPRRHDERTPEVRAWWRGTDDRIERVLSHRQRETYRHLTHRYRDHDRGHDRGRGGERPRGSVRGWGD